MWAPFECRSTILVSYAWARAVQINTNEPQYSKYNGPGADRPLSFLILKSLQSFLLHVCLTPWDEGFETRRLCIWSYTGFLAMCVYLPLILPPQDYLLETGGHTLNYLHPRPSNISDLSLIYTSVCVLKNQDMVLCCADMKK